MIIRWKGSASTPNRLCASSHARCRERSGRKVKKSAKIRRWVTMPEMSAISSTIAQAPTIQRPTRGGSASSKWKR